MAVAGLLAMSMVRADRPPRRQQNTLGQGLGPRVGRKPAMGSLHGPLRRTCLGMRIKYDSARPQFRMDACKQPPAFSAAGAGQERYECNDFMAWPAIPPQTGCNWLRHADQDGYAGFAQTTGRHAAQQRRRYRRDVGARDHGQQARTPIQRANWAASSPMDSALGVLSIGTSTLEILTGSLGSPVKRSCGRYISMGACPLARNTFMATLPRTTPSKPERPWVVMASSVPGTRAVSF